MVLHFYDRKSRFFRHHHGIVLRMHVTADDFRLYFQKRFESSDRLPKCFDCTQIFQITYIWRWIKTVIHTDTERVLKFSTDGKHLSPIWCGNHKRKWCVPSGTTDHIWFILIKIHHGIICPNANFAVMGQHTITKSGQFGFRFLIISADWRAGSIATCHHQKFRHFDSVIIGKYQKLHRCIREHHSHFRVTRSHRRAEDF